MDVREIGIPVNYLKGGIYGYLFFKEDEIYFQPSKFNIRKKELHIRFNEIRGVEPYKALGILNERFIIYTKDDKQYKFSAFNSKKLVEYIRSNI